MDPIQPIIPPAPWYTSPTQVAGVVAGLSQIASIMIRWFNLGITDEQLQACGPCIAARLPPSRL